MRAPSVEAIQTAFPKFGSDRVTQIREVLTREQDGLRPLRRLGAVNELLGFYGVEHISHGRNSKSPAIDYCNIGDPYNTTILLVNGQFRIGCWGDIVERGNYE